MELANYHRPHRAVIRCKAKMQLLQATDACFDWAESGSDALLEELAATLFQSNQYQIFYQQFHSKQEAKEAEDRLATELAETFQTILKRQHDPIVQAFNSLL